MKILALDPATQAGWAYTTGGAATSGTWDLSVRRDESGGMRLIRLKGKLNEFLITGIDLLIYEAARNAAPSMQGALVVQATLQGVITLWAEENGIQYRGYSPTEIKKFATGKGNANKAAVMAAAKERGWYFRDDNEADALWLLELARRDYGAVKV